MKPNTRLPRHHLSRWFSQTMGCLYPHLSRPVDIQLSNMCTAHWMLQECLHHSWGNLQLPLYEHWKEVKYTFYFQVERTKLYISSRRHKVTLLEATLNSVASTSEESSRTCIWTESFFQGPWCSPAKPPMTTHEDKQLMLSDLFKPEKLEGKVKTNQMPIEVTLRMHKYEQVFYG